MERIDSNVIVGINPNYCMRRDGGVGTLCEGGRVFEEIPHREGFLTHIHLLTAILCLLRWEADATRGSTTGIGKAGCALRCLR